MTESYNFGPENEEILSDAKIIYIGAAVYDRSANVKMIPIVMDDGRVGYAVKNADGDQCEFIYFNPSEDTGGSPDVFVYQGPTNDPVQDVSQHFYLVAEDFDASDD